MPLIGKLIVQQAFKGHGIPISGSAWPEHWASIHGCRQSHTIPRERQPFSNQPVLRELRQRSRKAGSQASLHVSVSGECSRFGNVWPCLFSEISPRSASICSSSRCRSRNSTSAWRRAISTRCCSNTSSETAPAGPSPSGIPRADRTYGGSKAPRSIELSMIFATRRTMPSIARHSGSFSSKRSTIRRRSFLALGEITRAVSKRFQVVAPAGSDILPTIADWRLAEDPERVAN